MPRLTRRTDQGELPLQGYRSLLRVMGLIDRVMQPYFGRFGISRSQWACLRVLYRAEEEGLSSVRPADLGRRLLIRPPSVTGLIERLRRLGYVCSNSSSADMRGKEVRLSESGRALVERIMQGHHGQVASVMAGLDAPGQQQLGLLLQQLAEHLEVMASEESYAEL